MAIRSTRIEPGHDRLRLSGTALRESKRSRVCWLQTLCASRRENPVKNRSVRAIDADPIMLIDVLRQDEPVGSRRQNASGNLNRLTECDFGGLVGLICSSSRQDHQQSKQKRSGGEPPYDSNVLHDVSFVVCGGLCT